MHRRKHSTDLADLSRQKGKQQTKREHHGGDDQFFDLKMFHFEMSFAAWNGYVHYTIFPEKIPHDFVNFFS
jgi:hypothetical protein